MLVEGCPNCVLPNFVTSDCIDGQLDHRALPTCSGVPLRSRPSWLGKDAVDLQKVTRINKTVSIQHFTQTYLTL